MAPFGTCLGCWAAHPKSKFLAGDCDGDGTPHNAVYAAATGHSFYVGSASGFGQQLSFGDQGFEPAMPKAAHQPTQLEEFYALP